jgi:hypothetical protein
MQADILLLSILPTGANVLVRFSDAENLRVLPARQHPVFLIKKEKKRYEKEDHSFGNGCCNVSELCGMRKR